MVLSRSSVLRINVDSPVYKPVLPQSLLLFLYLHLLPNPRRWFYRKSVSDTEQKMQSSGYSLKPYSITKQEY